MQLDSVALQVQVLYRILVALLVGEVHCSSLKQGSSDMAADKSSIRLAGSDGLPRRGGSQIFAPKNHFCGGNDFPIGSSQRGVLHLVL